MVPDTFEELELKWADSKAINEDHIVFCKMCGKREPATSMRGIKYVKKVGEHVPVDKSLWYCFGCMDAKLYGFIIKLGLDIRILEGYEIKTLMEAYAQGDYERWLQDRAGRKHTY